MPIIANRKHRIKVVNKQEKQTDKIIDKELCQSKVIKKSRRAEIKNRKKYY